jgi:splicing factor 3A subunit 3
MLRHGKLERTLDVKEKSLPAYLEYAQTLYNYLLSFFERALPLINIRQKLKEVTEDFETAWEAGRVEGWAEGSSKPVPTKAVQANGDGIWCQYCELNLYAYTSQISYY